LKTSPTKALIFVANIALALFLSACGQDTPESSSSQTTQSTQTSQGESSTPEVPTVPATENPKTPSELVIGGLTAFTASNLDPASEWNGWFDSMFGIGETLFKLDDNMIPQPWLVKSYEYNTNDGVTWTFELRDDVNFTNGKKLTAQTVKDSLERTIEVCDRANSQLYIASIAADGQKLTIVTQKPAPTLIHELSDPMCVIEYVADGIDYEKAPVLTGPFVPERFVQNDIMVVTKFKDYWGGEPKLDRVTFKTFTDGDALTMALQSGEIDAAFDVPSTAFQLFTPDKYNILLTEGSRGQAIFFNFNSDYVSDVNMREAIAMAIDRKAYVNLLNGTAKVAYGLFPDSLSYGGVSNLKLKVTEASNLDDARAKLAASGYTDSDGDGWLEKNGKNINLIIAVGSGGNDSLFAQSLQSRLKEIGLKLDIKTYENANTLYSDNDFDIGMSGLMMAPTGNPQYFINLAFITGGSRNEGHYSNPEVDSLAKELETTYGQAKRDEITFKIEQIIIDDVSYVVFANRLADCVTKAEVKGIVMNPSEYYIIDKNTDIITTVQP
jgi:peptide/nickel transport system substrate-binding protein